MSAVRSHDVAEPRHVEHPEPATDVRRGRATDRLWLAAVAAAVVPIVVAGVRATDRGWLPIGDNAYFAIRARDVLTEHHPLLGTWTSASLSTGKDLNNPGPLLFDWLALPAKLVDGAGGLVLGVVLLNVAAVVGIAVLARRQGGPMLGAAAAAMAAALAWTMGSELLFDPWQPHSLLLPFLCFVVAVWAMACGDLVALPVAVGVGSFVLQTHLSYAVLVPLLGLFGVAALVFVRRRMPPTDRRLVTRTVAVTGVVAVACWAQPLLEQFTGDGEGNLSRLAGNAGGASDTVGVSMAARLVSGIVALPGWWLRPSFGDAYRAAWPGSVAPGAKRAVTDLPGTGAAVLGLVLLVAVLVAVAVLAHRRRDRAAVAAIATVAVGLVGALVTATTLPVGILGIAAHQFRWLWPLSVFTTFAVLVALRRPGLLAVAVAVLFAVLNLPTTNQEVGPSADAWSIPVVRDLQQQLAAADVRGPVLLEAEGLRFAEPYSISMLDELQRTGVEFTVDDPGLVRQLGPSRRDEGDAEVRLLVRQGAAALDRPPDTDPVAFHAGLTAAEARELDELTAEVGDRLASEGRPDLTDVGRLAAERGDLATIAADGPLEPGAVLTSGALVAAVELGYLEDDPVLDRFAELQRQFERETVALFLVPA